MDDDQKRVVLLLGSTGNGKSTLANVLTKSNRFKESEWGPSETKSHQMESVLVDKVTFVVIDTIGIGDTELSLKEVLLRIAAACRLVRGGLHQILFVTSKRFTREEIFAYNLLRSTIFNADVVHHTTIVRTSFPSWKNPEKCAEDIARLKQAGPDHAEIFSSCYKVIHVDNQPVIPDSPMAEIAQQLRDEAHLKLSVHLVGSCSSLYKPQGIEELNSRIENFQTEEEKCQNAIKVLQADLTAMKTEEAKKQAEYDAQMKALNDQRERDSQQFRQASEASSREYQQKMDGLVAQMLQDQKEMRERAERERAEAQARLEAQNANLLQLQTQIASQTQQHIQHRNPSWREQLCGGVVDIGLGILSAFAAPVKSCVIQ